MNKVLVLGDWITDVFIDHSSSRKSPEADCPVLTQTSFKTFDGGARNVFNNIVSLGGVARWKGLGPFNKTRILLNGKQICRIDQPPASNIAPLAWGVELNDLTFADVVVISDYGLGTISEPQALIGAIYGKPIIVDPDKRKTDWSVYQGATIIKCNEKEWSEAKNRPDCTYVITRGANGATWKDLEERSAWTRVAPKITPLDVTGCGDSFLACLAVGYGLYPAEKLVDQCNRAGAIACSRAYTAVIEGKDVYGEE